MAAKQRIIAGRPVPLYVNETNNNASVLRGVYIDQTSGGISATVNLAAVSCTGAVAAMGIRTDLSVTLGGASATGSVAAITTLIVGGKQRISAGFPRPFYTNSTNSNQSIVADTYVNQTIVVPPHVNINLDTASTTTTAVDFAPANAINVNLTAVSVTATVTSLSITNPANATGQLLLMSVGGAGIQGGQIINNNVPLTGAAATANANSFGGGTNVILAAATATSGVRSVTPALGVVLQPAQGVSASSAFAVTFDNSVSMQEAPAIASAGTIIASNGSAQLLTTVTLSNTSGSTMATQFITPMFGLAFLDGKIGAGTAPQFTLNDGITNVPFSMSVKPLYWPSGYLRHSAFLLRVPTTIAANSSITIKIFSGGTIPANSSRSTADYTAGGLDLNVSVTGLDGLSALPWVSDLGQGITTANSDNYKYMDGSVGRVDRIRASFRNSGVNHGYLEGYWYVAALQDNSGNLAGIRHLTRIASPWIEQNLGPGGASKNYMSFSAAALNNGVSQLVDLWSHYASTATFNYDAANVGSSATWFDIAANNYSAAFLCRLTTTGTLPTSAPQIALNTSYFLNPVAAGKVFFSNNPAQAGNSASGQFTPSNNGSGTHTITVYPYITAFGSFFTAKSNARWNYTQGAGSAATDPAGDNVLVAFDNVNLFNSQLTPSYDLSLGAVTPHSASSYYPVYPGPVTQALGNTGDRADIGVLTDWAVRHIYLQDAADEQTVRAVGLIGGSMPLCLRSHAAGGTLVCVNNGPGGAGGTYAGMHAPMPNMTWYASSGNGGSGFVVPSNSNVLSAGFSTLNTSHFPTMPYYPYIITGEPQYKDMIAEHGNWVIMQFDINNVATVNSVSYNPGARNPKLNGGTQFYGAASSAGGQRNAAWATRSLGEAAPWTYEECAAYTTYFQEMLSQTAAYGVALGQAVLASGNTYAYNNGIWWGVQSLVYQPTWQNNYMMTAMYHAYQLVSDPNMLLFGTSMANFCDYYTQAYGQFNSVTNATNIQLKAIANYGLITDSSLLTNNNSFVNSWNKATNFVNIVGGSVGNTPTLWTPTVNDTVMFYSFDIGSETQYTPFPTVFSDHVAYYIYSAVASVNSSYNCQLSLIPPSQGGATPITLTDSSTGSWQGWIVSNGNGTSTLHVNSVTAGTIWALPSTQANNFTISGAGVASAHVNAQIATQGSDFATYTISGQQTVGTQFAPVAMTGTLKNIQIFWRSTNPSTTGSHDSSGPSGYLSLFRGALRYGQAIGVPVSANTTNQLTTAFTAQGINWNQGPKYAFSDTVGG